MSPDDWFVIDMGSIQTINQVVVDATGPDPDHPTQLSFEVSLDGENYSLVHSIPGAAVTTGCFAPVEAHFVRLRPEIPRSCQWWSIYEIEIYAPAPDGDAGILDAGLVDAGDPVPADASTATDAGIHQDASSDASN